MQPIDAVKDDICVYGARAVVIVYRIFRPISREFYRKVFSGLVYSGMNAEFVNFGNHEMSFHFRVWKCNISFHKTEIE